MIGFLLGLALLVFAIWLVFTIVGLIIGGLIHLLWIVIIIALVIVGMRALTGARRSRTL
jgi:hypothetical protein